MEGLILGRASTPSSQAPSMKFACMDLFQGKGYG
ncbi:Uncharacterised protein [Bordetella pertussis]|nr:Uncharacterised protein [Bordetella pertussis]